MTTQAAAETTDKPNNLAPETAEKPEKAATEAAPAPKTTETTTETETTVEKKPRDSQARIRELVAREKAAVEYAEYWRERATTGAKPAAADPPAEKPAPKLSDFKGDTEKWAAAHHEWTEAQIEKRAAAAVERRSAENLDSAVKSELNQQWQTRCEAFAEKTPDFFEVIGNPRLPITQTMTEVLQSSDRGAEVAYFLGTNPGEAARIARMSPAQQAAALGRLETKLEKPAEKPKPQTTKAPEPPNPVGGGGTSRVDIESMTAKQYLDYKIEKMRQKKRH